MANIMKKIVNNKLKLNKNLHVFFFSLDSAADHHRACIQELYKKVSFGYLRRLD